MPLVTEVGLGPGHIVFRGDPAGPKRGTAPNFRPVSIVAKRSPISAILLSTCTINGRSKTGWPIAKKYTDDRH